RRKIAAFPHILRLNETGLIVAVRRRDVGTRKTENNMAGSMKIRRKLAYRRHILVSSVTTGLLASTSPVSAACTESNGWQCNYSATETYTTIQGTSVGGYNPPHGNGTT